MTEDEGSDNKAYLDNETPESGQDRESLDHEKEKENDINPQTRASEYSDDTKKSSISASEEDVEDHRCGWFNIRPRWMQCFNRPAGFLVVIFLFSLAQSTTVNGLVYIVTTTLERRFNLPSTRSGSISSMYDFSVLIVIVFVTYFGERANKPVWLGTGALIFGLGSFLFTLPHFLTEYYTYGAADDEEVCNVTRTVSDQCEEDDGNLSQYYYCFLAAQFLHGIGSSPLYTLGQTYIYDNTKPREAPVFLGIFQVASNFAPAIGFIGGGLLLTVYTDLQHLYFSLSIDPSSPLWVGNWWLGFICTGTVAWLTAIPLLAFPRRLPGTEEYENERRQLAQSGSRFRPSGYGTVEKLKDFPRAVFNLLKNLPCLCAYLASGTEFFIIACISVFGPKFVESQFSLTAGEAAIFSGLVVVPSALAGVLLGGWLVKCFDWKFRGKIRFVLMSLSIGMISMFVLIIRCPNVPFAGVTVTYENQTQRLDVGESNITSACNVDCNCGTNYDPVCGISNNVMYYTACHAGCKFMDTDGDDKIYSNCTCIEEVGSEGIAKQGKCYHDCDNQTVFFFGVFGGLLFGFAIVVPSVTAILSVVDESQRSLSLGLQSLFYRCLGTVPGPIIFGKLIDSACMIWEYECEGQGTCWVYQNDDFATSLFLVVLSCRLLSIVFYSGSLLFYKPLKKEIGEDGDDEKKEEIDLSQTKTTPSSTEEGMEVAFKKDADNSYLEEKESI
ncbi:Solute carrier organic anion transporter family member 4A1 [Holothuria leucospilota]|uniref:Solute carrier organic anion transporter family member n=1 Tax=Holothuria leucospilota TaxID=206669 RepID=A0A9Q0YDH2_HOLLE|nr:Solute carrier organic anion transporter family member 4A1 [Holothuria leucospilota]